MLRHVSQFAAIAMLTFPAVASAGTVNRVNGTVQPVPMLTTFQTWGGPGTVPPLPPNPPDDYIHNMEGIEVTVHFSGGTSETKSWTGAGFADPGGGVEGDDGDWSLSNLTTPVFDHTYANPWVLTYSGGAKGNLVAFDIDGFGKLKNSGQVEGNTAFDTFVSPEMTPASSSGNPFNVIGNTHDTDATYSDVIAVGGNPPAGDLYRRLRVDFKGKVGSKWLQRPQPSVGENIHSDVDWRLAMTPNGDRQAAADDFISNGRPITGIRWWGSYFDPNEQPQPDPINGNLVPPAEEGYVISFFANGATAPGPGQLLGMYEAPASAVDIQPTGLTGWDGHPVWEYVVDLDETLLEHRSDLATPESFNEIEGTEYWISIAAENGHEIDVAGGTTNDNGDPIRTTSWWGWHTTPDAVTFPAPASDSPPFAAGIAMDGDQWVYFPWNIADQQHPSPNLNNLSFELLTIDPSTIGLSGAVGNDMMSFVADTDTVVGIPEPAGGMLILLALVATFLSSPRRRA
jgi:hypothetical protein